MRARQPDESGTVERNGVKTYYEVFGRGERTILFLPTWALVHSRYWKLQVPYFSRYARVITFDPRGHQPSDSPAGPEAYAPAEYAADALAVIDKVGVERATVVGLSNGAKTALVLAADHADRIDAVVFNCPSLAIGEAIPGRDYDFLAEIDTDEGWAKFNKQYWLRDFERFLEFFMTLNFNQPHSSKPFEDAMEWARETTPEVLADTFLGGLIGMDEQSVRDLCARVRCPVLVIQGQDDQIVGPGRGIALAGATGGELALLQGAGHSPHTRDPVKFNLLVRDFLGLRPLATTYTRWNRRRRRALFVSSPIGLGHALRDIAIADELRKVRPDLDIEWLAQSPVTRALTDRGEQIHPASVQLASEVAHIDAESHEHDLHVFQAWRRMDEIMLANFMLFNDLMEQEAFDLVIGDEAWDLDHFWHENPELKRAPFVWMTDFVGWIPMPSGGHHEAWLAADYNAEMIEHIERFPRLRDRSIFVGNPDDIVPDSFGLDLPLIRGWTEEHFEFSGYITGFDPTETEDRGALRERLGYAPGEKVCIVTVGGSGAGASLLRRVVASYPEAKRRVPELRMVVVAGPRIDPQSLPRVEGLEVHAYVPGLYRHLAACDVAVVQGGLTTCMELTANRRPFLYFPLQNHFEQNFHVPHRLGRYGAGRRMEYASSPPEIIAEAIARELAREVTYRPVETGGAASAAALIAESL
ncbi:MAG: alpha/beta fold hydrolase [Actinomycetota bacterium]|nr:alpha/beta fold hydrolase [Actinomycetota bacterium]